MELTIFKFLTRRLQRGIYTNKLTNTVILKTTNISNNSEYIQQEFNHSAFSG